LGGEFSAENLLFWRDAASLEEEIDVFLFNNAKVIGPLITPSSLPGPSPSPSKVSKLTSITEAEHGEIAEIIDELTESTRSIDAKKENTYSTELLLNTLTKEQKKIISAISLIYEKYIDPDGAPYSINISGANRNAISRKFHDLILRTTKTENPLSMRSEQSTLNLTVDPSETPQERVITIARAFPEYRQLFADAREEIIQLMETDCYPRFLATRDLDNSLSGQKSSGHKGSSAKESKEKGSEGKGSAGKGSFGSAPEDEGDIAGSSINRIE